VCSSDLAFKAVFDANDAHAVFASRGLYDSTNNGVKSGRVTATCQDANGSKHGAKSNIADCQLPILNVWRSIPTNGN